MGWGKRGIAPPIGDFVGLTTLLTDVVRGGDLGKVSLPVGVESTPDISFLRGVIGETVPMRAKRRPKPSKNPSFVFTGFTEISAEVVTAASGGGLTEVMMEPASEVVEVE